MEETKVFNLITKILIAVFIISILAFAFSYFNISNVKDIEKENIELKEKLTELAKKESDIEEKYTAENIKFEEVELNFASKYGYDYTEKESDIVKSELDTLKNRNVEIKSQLQDEIKKYSDYYSGDYYKSENVEEVIAKFTSLSSISDVDYLTTDLYEYSEIESFINEAKNSGTIKYLSSQNKSDIKSDILFFTTVMYSKNLFEIGNGLSDIGENLNKIYAQIVSITDVYKNMETFGIKTGKLSYSNLENLKKSSLPLIREYFENKGVIESLESLGEDNEKSK